MTWLSLSKKLTLHVELEQAVLLYSCTLMTLFCLFRLCKKCTIFDFFCNKSGKNVAMCSVQQGVDGAERSYRQSALASQLPAER